MGPQKIAPPNGYEQFPMSPPIWVNAPKSVPEFLYELPRFIPAGTAEVKPQSINGKSRAVSTERTSKDTSGDGKAVDQSAPIKSEKKPSEQKAEDNRIWVALVASISAVACAVVVAWYRLRRNRGIQKVQ